MSILVVAEHDQNNVKVSTRVALAAAKALGGDIHLLIAGQGCQGAVDAAVAIEGVQKVLVADNELYAHDLAEELAALIVSLAGGYSHILTATTTSGKNYMPRVAALLDVSQISDIISVESTDTFKRPIYAGNAVATVQSSDAVKVLTVRGTAFDPVSDQGGSASIETVDAPAAMGVSEWIREDVVELERPELTAASIIVSGGRGMQNGENFQMLESVADKMGAAIGASRAAVDAGFVPNDMQVGQTGKIVAPDLYIAVGISGAIQHLAGMKDSKVIVAINKDEDAPIFQVADYGLVADLFKAVPELDSML